MRDQWELEGGRRRVKDGLRVSGLSNWMMPVVRIYAVEVSGGKRISMTLESKWKTPKAQLPVVSENSDPSFRRVEPNSLEGLSCCHNIGLSRCVTVHLIPELM